MFFHWALLLAEFPDGKSLSLRFPGSSLMYKKTRFYFLGLPYPWLRFHSFMRKLQRTRIPGQPPGTRCSTYRHKLTLYIKNDQDGDRLFIVTDTCLEVIWLNGLCISF